MLEKFKGAFLIAKTKLTQPITISAFSSYVGAVISGDQKVGRFGLYPGQSRMLYFESIPPSKMPKQSTAGSYFSGNLCLVNGDNGDVRKAVQFETTYMILDSNKAISEKASLSTVDVEKKKSSNSAFTELEYKGKFSLYLINDGKIY